MALRTRIPGLLILASLCPPAEAMTMYDPRLCYILDGFLGLYGLIITGMFIKEKFFRSKSRATDSDIYSEPGGFPPRMKDAERGKNRRMIDDNDTYTGLTHRTDGEYKELPVKKERHRRTDQVYQDLSSATKDTYQSLQMKPLQPR